MGTYFYDAANLCTHDPSKGNYCDEAAEKKLKADAQLAQSKLTVCKGASPDCTELANQFNRYWDWTSRCVKYSGP